jgi:hypothetical protein
MAEVLKRKYDLVVLKVTLDTTGEQSRVRCAVEVKIGGEPRVVAEWTSTAAERGVPERIDRRSSRYRGYQFAIPEQVSSPLRDWVEHEMTADVPLWVHLVRPCGYLAMVPWERLLQPLLKVPMLRLPEFVVQPPRETPKALDVLLCSSGPAAKEQFRMVEYLKDLAKRLREAVPRRTTFHVFTDKAIHQEIGQAFEREGLLNSTAILYSPDTAASYSVPAGDSDVPEQTRTVANPWLLWMRESLKGRSVDVAHFVCHGYLSHDHGALAFAESPLVNQDTRMARFVGGAELKAFLTQVGAWSAVFSSPERNYSEMGLRQLADGLAQVRPGPIVHHELELDRDGSAIAGAYRLLFSRTPQPAPASAALFIYCQPFRVQAPAGAEDRTRAAASVPASSELDSLYETEDNVPAWVAASERYVEECQLRLQKLQPEQDPASADSDRQRNAQMLEATLQQIRDVVARVAKSEPRRRPQ